MIFGREKELAHLATAYAADNAFSMTVIYGRRRVGKTALIREHLLNRKAIYFQGIEGTAAINLAMLTDTIRPYVDLPADYNFTTLDEALKIITKLSLQNEKLIFVIDEYPYLAGVLPEISSLLQYYIDHEWLPSGNMQLILAGSSMSFMQNQVLGHQSPLYGRKTSQIHVKPFTLLQTNAFLETMPLADVIAYYGITGGTPHYLNFIKRDLSVAENIQQLFLTEFSPLFDEPRNLLNQELTDPIIYNSLLAAMAQGSSKLNQIATKAGAKPSNATQRLANLKNIGIITKLVPWDVKEAKGIYKFQDGLFRFWYRFIYPNQALIELDKGDVLLVQIMAHLPEFLGPAFEEAAREWIYEQEALGNFPTIAPIDNWWGANPVTKQAEEIDLLGQSLDGQTLLIGECKWLNKRVTPNLIKQLVERSELFKHDQKIKIFFSKAGYTPEAVAVAAKLGVQLVSLDEMFK